MCASAKRSRFQTPRCASSCLYRWEQAAEVLKSAPTNVDKLSQVAFKASGDKLGLLFDGSQQLVSVTAIPYYSRQVYPPEF